MNEANAAVHETPKRLHNSDHQNIVLLVGSDIMKVVLKVFNIHFQI